MQLSQRKPFLPRFERAKEEREWIACLPSYELHKQNQPISCHSSSRCTHTTLHSAPYFHNKFCIFRRYLLRHSQRNIHRCFSSISNLATVYQIMLGTPRLVMKSDSIHSSSDTVDVFSFYMIQSSQSTHCIQVFQDSTQPQ